MQKLGGKYKNVFQFFNYVRKSIKIRSNFLRFRGLANTAVTENDPPNFIYRVFVFP